MISSYTFFDSTGQISSTVSGVTDELLPMYHAELPGTEYIKGEYSNDNYWIDPVTKEPQIRPDLLLDVDKTELLADGIDEVTISNIPDGTQVEVYPGPETGITDPLPIIIDNGVLTLSTEAIGEYHLFASKFPHKNFTVVLTALNPVRKVLRLNKREV